LAGASGESKTSRNAIVVGASSGIGREVARILYREGYGLGLCARRIDLLRDLQNELVGSFVRRLDLSQTDEAINLINDLMDQMGGVDLVVVSSGTGFINPESVWQYEKTTIEVNVMGFCAITNAAMNHFQRRGSGHLVGISSIAALRGTAEGLTYNASKAFVSNYLEGLRQRVRKRRLPITVTEIQPGFVDTDMAKGDRLFWVSSPEEAARQIHRAITKKRDHAYVTRRWRLIAWLFRILPAWALR
jgi:short-subunit dehydrogenase